MRRSLFRNATICTRYLLNSNVKPILTQTSRSPILFRFCSSDSSGDKPNPVPESSSFTGTKMPDSLNVIYSSNIDPKESVVNRQLYRVGKTISSSENEVHFDMEAIDDSEVASREEVREQIQRLREGDANAIPDIIVNTMNRKLAGLDKDDDLTKEFVTVMREKAKDKLEFRF